MTTLEELAFTKHLLVVSDFDGTLAGFHADPAQVPVNTDSIAALEQLAALPNTTVVLLSGRHLDGLKAIAPVSDALILVGSHGAESTEDSDTTGPNVEQQHALDQLTTKLNSLITKYPGAYVENKPFHRVLHSRLLEDYTQENALFQAAFALGGPDFHITHGKKVLEFSVQNVTKGTWISAARDRYKATAVVFLGDDQTDEDGFRVLGADDLGVKVGIGDTIANARLDSLDDVADFLTELSQRRGVATVEPG